MSSASPIRLESYTRIGVIGDIHTRADRLMWAIGTLKEQGSQALFATGDIVDGPHPRSIARVCDLLRRERVATVLGNHDRWLLDEQQREIAEATFPEDVDLAARSFLLSLPQIIELPTPSGLALLGHGLGSNDMTSLYPYDHGPALKNNTVLQAILRAQRYRYVIGGHTHLRMVRAIGGVTFINAGALHYTNEPCCLLLDFAARRAQFLDYAHGHGPSFAL